MMDPQLIEHLRVDDPMEEPELNLDNIPISSIQVLLEPPTSLPGGDDDDSFYSPLDHFQNLVKLTMTNSQCQSLEGFPHLPLLRTLLLADNELSTGFEALAEADLQTLVRLDLTANKISDLSVLRPLNSLENLQYLYLAENEVADKEGYRDEVFDILPQLVTVDGLDRDGTEVAEQRDNIVPTNEEAEYSEGSEGEYDDEGRPQVHGGKYPSHEYQGGEEEDEEEYDEEDDDEYEAGPPAHHPQSHHNNDDESEDIGSEEEEEEDYDEEERYDSNSDSDKENRPLMSGKTTGPSNTAADEEDDDELEEEEDEDDEEEDHQQQQQHSHHQEVGSDSGEEDEEDDDLEEEEDEDEEEEEEEEEGPGLAYLLTEDIPSENDDEFEPGNEVEEESEIESSDEDEFGSSSKASAGPTLSSSNTNGHPPKRPRSPALEDTVAFDHGPADVIDGSNTGFDVDGEDANGFGMASFDGPATFDEESGHDSKRPRT
ncbi:hypothetical protein EMPS_08249 [Entomortierella parvispora]|uniref:U2A'/phosphoprotein 32 family A C-terminal domain-containing protein n=1 Tax=Entomortierella parvispora TaxID=205924 RepID=A0A9P3HG11_9FUNG|nr:hypothetical protein EMPS_08249 [Entomortierella parvispora]